MNKLLFWTEKYRPKKVADCILPDSIKSIFQGYVDKGVITNLLLHGTSGLGKTTIARALCEEIGCDYLFVKGSDENGLEAYRTKIKNYASTVSFSGGRKVIIIDEADKLTAPAQDALRGGIEEVASNCSFIFTCNHKSRLTENIQSRFSAIDFTLSGSKQKMAAQFLKRVEFILTNENIKYEKEVLVSVIMKYFPDNRRILNELQMYSIAGNGVIDKGILGNIIDVKISELIKALSVKDFASCRKWVIGNLDNDPDKVFRMVYDGLYESLMPNSVPQLVLILAKYGYQSSFCADQEINFLACLTEIMIDCTFK
jgi:DNA polymerase III delta prime subunit